MAISPQGARFRPPRTEEFLTFEWQFVVVTSRYEAFKASKMFLQLSIDGQ